MTDEKIEWKEKDKPPKNVNLYFSFLELILYKKFHSPYWITVHNTNMIGRKTILFVPNLVTRMVKGL